jgi:hypothetical protein
VTNGVRSFSAAIWQQICAAMLCLDAARGNRFTDTDPLNVGATLNARHRSASAIELRLEERPLEQGTAGCARVRLTRTRIESLAGVR